jgi:hypothetical protein
MLSKCLKDCILILYYRQIYLKKVPNSDPEICADITSKVVDVDKEIENSVVTASPFKKLHTSLKKIHKTSLPSTQNSASLQPEESNNTPTDRKGTKEKCKLM